MTAYYNENNPYAAEWLRNLIDAGAIAPGVVDTRSILDVQPDDLLGFTQCHFFAGIGGWSYALRLAGWPDDRPVWTGSCPCQPFSSAGKGKGTKDERHLWPDWFRLISKCRPDVIFGEQVESAVKHGWIDLVSDDLETVDYAIGTVPAPAAGVGAPHNRPRLLFVADRYQQRWEEHPQLRADQARRIKADLSQASGRSVAGDLADSDGPQQHGQRQPGAGGRSESADRRDLGLIDLGNPGGAGFPQRQEPANIGTVIRIEGAALNPAGSLRGFWRNPDWIYCTDGKYRPVEPGSFPLVDGLSADMGSVRPGETSPYRQGKDGLGLPPWRTGMLQGYGNAIVPELAAEFIGAYLDGAA